MNLNIIRRLFVIGFLPYTLCAMQEATEQLTTPENVAKIEQINALWRGIEASNWCMGRLTPSEITRITSTLNIIINDLENNQLEKARRRMPLLAVTVRNTANAQVDELPTNIDQILTQAHDIHVLEAAEAINQYASDAPVPQQKTGTHPNGPHQLVNQYYTHRRALIIGVLAASVIGYIAWRLWPSHAPEEPERS